MNGTFLAGLIAPLLAAPACLALIIYAFPRRHPPGIHVTPWIAAAALAWATSDLLVASAPPALAFPWILTLWLKSRGMDLLPLASLAQILQVTGQSRRLGRNAGVLICVLLLSEQGLFWFENRLNQPQEIYSAWNALILLLRVGPLLAAGFLLAYHFLQAPRLYQRISWTYLAGSLLIGIAYILEFAGVSLASSSHLSPLLAVISQAGFYSGHKYEPGFKRGSSGDLSLGVYRADFPEHHHLCLDSDLHHTPAF